MFSSSKLAQQRGRFHNQAEVFAWECMLYPQEWKKIQSTHTSLVSLQTAELRYNQHNIVSLNTKRRF